MKAELNNTMRNMFADVREHKDYSIDNFMRKNDAEKLAALKTADESCKTCKSRCKKGLMDFCSLKKKHIKVYNLCPSHSKPQVSQ